MEQTTSHTPEVQIGVLPGELGQTVQLGPQEVAEFATQAPPQRLKLVAQVKPQLVPSQVAKAFAGAVQAVHDVAPQLAMELLLTQLLPQR